MFGRRNTESPVQPHQRPAESNINLDDLPDLPDILATSAGPAAPATPASPPPPAPASAAPAAERPSLFRSLDPAPTTPLAPAEPPRAAPAALSAPAASPFGAAVEPATPSASASPSPAALAALAEPFSSPGAASAGPVFPVFARAVPAPQAPAEAAPAPAPSAAAVPAVSPASPVAESVIGPDDFFEGSYRSERGVRIQGTARGSIESRQYIYVEEGARVEASLTAEEITIAGSYSGTIECHGRLEITGSGQVQGSIKTVRLSIREGGVLDGKVQMQAEKTEERSEQSAES
jgi:cytoskeletal protein CcmA (bactofilin family)